MGGILAFGRGLSVASDWLEVAKSIFFHSVF